MGERLLEASFALVAAVLIACAELVELFEPKGPAPEWRYRSYRAALRLTAIR
jgi:hypothetical protein